jgi:hypothetical protein
VGESVLEENVEVEGKGVGEAVLEESAEAEEQGVGEAVLEEKPEKEGDADTVTVKEGEWEVEYGGEPEGLADLAGVREVVRVAV